jgi:hypothetical protein
MCSALPNYTLVSTFSQKADTTESLLGLPGALVTILTKGNARHNLLLLSLGNFDFHNFQELFCVKCGRHEQQRQ